MKKILSSLKCNIRALPACLVVCVLFAGCADDSYHGAAARYRDDTIPLPVNVFVGEPVNAETKGHGTVDFKDGMTFDGRYIYVYAFNRLAGTDFNVTSATNPAICLVDGSKDEPGSIGGKQAILSDLASYAEWTGSDTPLYPTGEMKSIPYEFFAYHIDTIKLAEANIHRTSDNINIDLTFDGSIDIMTAHSVFDEDPEEEEPEKEQEEQPTEPEAAAGDGTKADGESLRGYSYDTARRGIAPVFTFEHKLVKLVFEVKAGVIESRLEKTLTVQDIKVESPSKANLTVAYRQGWTGEAITFDEASTSFLQLREKDGEEMPRDHYVIQNPPLADDTPPLRVGGSLLVAPQQSYRAYVTVSEVSAAGEHEDVNPIDIEFPEGFNTGCCYLVTLKLFGYMAVEPTITLVPWNYGGEIDLPDYEYPGY